MNRSFYKIVHLIPGLYLGGSEKVLELIACHQHELGHEVTVIAFENSGFEKYFPHLTIRHCQVQYQDSLLQKPSIHIQEYESIITELSPDVIHSHAYWTDLISHYHCRREILYISHFHLCYNNFDNLALKTLTKNHIYTWIDKQKLLKRYYQPNCELIAASYFINSFIKKRLPRKIHNKIHCLLNPVDQRYFNVRQVNSKQFDFITVGRLEEVKDHDFLISVVFELNKKGHSPRVAIVGDGTLRSDLEKKCAILGLSDNLKFLGAVKDLTEIFRDSSVYIHTAQSETFGLVIYEAMAAGLPIIIRRFNGLDERLINSSNSFILNDMTAEAFAEQISRIVSNKSLLDSMAESKESIRNLSSETYLCRMDQFYLEKLRK